MSAKTSSRQSKLDKKVKLAVGRSKSPQDGGETLNSKKKGFQTNKNSKNSLDDGIGVTYENNKLYRKKSSGVRNVKLKTKDETAFVQKDHGDRTMHNDRKRKRVFAYRNNSEEGMLHKNLRKGSQRGNTEIDDAVVEGRRSWRGKSQKGKGFRGEGKSCKIDSFDDFKKLSQKLKTVKKDPTIVLGYRKQTERNDNGGAAESLGKSTKKKSHEQKSLGDGLEEKPKRKKRVIRIDLHDISNKRLDEGILTTAAAKKKEENMEKNEGVNAQFRAIIPSPSILSFVEENFLGRRRMIELRRAGYNTEFSAPLDNIPSSKSSERERIEEPVFRNKLEFFAAANVSSSFPPPDLPEIAFAGRSNVGKSSLLNALTRQWGVVRTSDKPGLTQTINFFKLGTKFCLVDLPGYGFAYAKEEVKEAWEELVKEYVSSRAGLKRVCLLIDTKWGMKPRDYELISLMEKSQTKYQVVLTKTDLVFPIDVARRAMQIEESLKAKKSAVQPVMMVSSKSGAGVRSLRTVLAKIARFAKL